MERFLLIVSCLFWATACVQPQTIECGDGRVCPGSTRCDLVHQRCISVAQEAACDGHVEGDTCMFGGAAGACRAGVCEVLTCGDGIINGAEQCDGSELGGKTCLDLHFYGETAPLACKSNCTFDTTGCVGACGDGIKNGPEACDGDDVGQASCIDVGFYNSPGLACSPFCTFDVSACTGSCGDKIVNGNELCDGAPPASGFCVDYGFNAGPLGCAANCGLGFAECASFGWHEETLELSSLNSIGGTAHDDVWIVGNGGVGAHSDGIAWTLVPTGTSQNLHALWSIAKNDVWAVGDAATVLHWDGTAWGTVPAPSSENYVDVWAASATAVFVVGDAGGAFRWNGSSWSDLSPGSGQPFTGIHGTGPSDVWAVSGKLVLRWNGTGWATAFDNSPGDGFMDIDARATDDVWAVGGHAPLPEHGVTAHWDGLSWKTLTVPGVFLKSVRAISPRDIWAGGSSGRAVHFDGHAWSTTTMSHNGPSALAVHSVPGEVLALGSSEVGRLRGPVYSPNQVTTTGTRIWATASDDVYVLNNQYINHYDGVSWTQPTAVSDPVTQAFKDIWGSGRSDVFAVGGPGIVSHFDGMAWSAQTVPSMELDAVWGSGPSDVWAVGDGILHYDGMSWSTVVSMNGSGLYHLSGTASDDVWALGLDVLMHWNGSAWSPVTLPVPPNYSTLWVAAKDRVIVTTDARHALTWDGSVWHDQVLPLSTFLADMNGSAPDDIFGVNDLEAVHFDGTRWSPLTPPVGSIIGVRALPATIFMLDSWGVVSTLIRTRPWVCRAHETGCADGLDDDCDGLPDELDPDCP